MITRNFNLYLNAGHSVPLVINVNQYDSGEQWVFTLYNSDGTQYTPSSGSIIGIKADGYVIANAGTVDESGRVVITETEQMTAAAGKAVFELQLDSNTHGTANFIVLVENDPSDGGEVSGSDISLLRQALDGGLSQTAIDALLACFANVAWVNEDGQTYYDALEDALNAVRGIILNTSALSFSSIGSTQQLTATTVPEGGTVTWASSNTSVATVSSSGLVTSTGYGTATITASADEVSATCSVAVIQATLVSISAVYTQSGTVYNTDSLDSLKSDLVVTATYDNATTETVSSADYTLSGTLTAGTSTITVAYGNKTATFNVTVTHAVQRYTITNNLTHVTNTNNATSINENLAYNAALTVGTGYLMNSVTVTMGGVDITATAYDSSNNTISIASVTGNIIITAEAIEDLGYESGVPYTFTLTDGYVVDGTSYELVESSGMSYVELPCKGVDYIERYWSQFGGTCRMDFYDENNTHLQAATLTTTGTIGYTVAKDATKVIVSGTTGRMQNLTVTPYVYPSLGENTAWTADTIYTPEECELSGTTVSTGYMFAALAGTVSASVGYTTGNTRGQYFFYDQSKTLISQTSTAEIVGGTGIWRTPVEIPSGTYYVKISLYNIGDVHGGNALDNFRVVYDRVVE